MLKRFVDDFRETGAWIHHDSMTGTQYRQDTHVPRQGRDLIRKTLEDADVPCSVGA